MKPRGRILTLTTDFGTADGYAGAIRGVVLSLAPGTPIVDISHDIAPQNIWQGAWALRRAAPHFPPDSIHLALVDPGVGSERAGVVIQTGTSLLIGPDNGVLSLAARDAGVRRVIEIDEDNDLWRKSASFDGLTLFAPVAGHLLSGMALDEVGPEAEDLIELTERQAQVVGNLIEGSVMLFDRFGNAITDIPARALEDREVEKIYLRNSIEARFCAHYHQLAGNPVVGAILNSDGYLELTQYGESLQARFKLENGDPVRVLLKPL